MVLIDDGTGTGKRAKVNDQNQIETRATQHSEAHFVSENAGEAFFSSTAQTSTSTLTFLTTETGDAIHIKNTGSVNLTISAIILNASAAGGVASIVKNKIEGTITQNTTVIANNLNFGSAKSATTVVDVWDETNGDGIQGLTGGDVLTSLTIPPAAVVINTDGTIVIPQGQRLTVNFNNITGGTIEVSVGLRYYFDDA